jgi:hypothetical protein
MNCTIYIVYCKFVIHATCLLDSRHINIVSCKCLNSKIELQGWLQNTFFFRSCNDLKIELDHMELKKNSNANKYVIYHTNSFPSKLFYNLAYSVLLLLYPPCQILTLHVYLIYLVGQHNSTLNITKCQLVFHDIWCPKLPWAKLTLDSNGRLRIFYLCFITFIMQIPMG